MTVNDLFSNSPPRVSHSLSFLFVGVCVGYDVTGRPGRGQSLIGYDHHCCCMITNHRLHTFTFPWIKDYHLLWWRGWSKEKFFSIYEWKRIFSHWKLEISISVTFRPMLVVQWDYNVNSAPYVPELRLWELSLEIWAEKSRSQAWQLVIFWVNDSLDKLSCERIEVFWNKYFEFIN